jgi:hypothetical protein
VKRSAENSNRWQKIFGIRVVYSKFKLTEEISGRLAENLDMEEIGGAGKNTVDASAVSDPVESRRKLVEVSLEHGMALCLSQ